LQDHFVANGSRTLRIPGALEWLLWALAVYAIPCAIALVSLAAAFYWQDQYSGDPEKILEMRVLAPVHTPLAPAAALGLLKTAPIRTFYEAKSIDGPVWFGLTTPQEPDTNQVVELPSRHATSLTCWDARTLELLGDSKALDDNTVLTPVKSGYALTPLRPGAEVLCRATFLGPVRLTAELWKPAKFERSAREFHRVTGLMDGGLIILALFVLLTALINRQPVYVIFAVWLIATLRSAAISSGWDMQWLGYTVPENWLIESRSLTRATYSLLTLTLFRALFHEDLAKTRFGGAIRVTHWLCLPLLLAAVTLPRSIFIPALWFIGGPGLLLMIVSLVSIVRTTRSRVVIWYGASLAVTLLSSLAEILAAASDLRGLIGPSQGVIAAMAASLLASVAIAEQMREEHGKRLAVQAELQHTYDVMPIGLFTLDLGGRFTSANPALMNLLGANVLAQASSAWKHYFCDESWTELNQMLYRGDHDEIEVRGRQLPGAGEPKRFLVKATLADGRIEGSLQDVTETSRATEGLRFLVNHDSLTRVLNRRGIEAAFEVAASRIADSRSLALAYLDLDHFKLINEQFGHGAGDEVLREVCQRVMAMMPRDLHFGRIGGDEFVIVFPDTTVELATLLCRGIIEIIRSAPYQVGEKARLHVRCSIGLTEVSAGMQFNDAVSSADRACGQAKSASGAGLVVYEKRDPLAEVMLQGSQANG